MKKIILIAAVSVAAACAQKGVNLVGLADEGHSFVRVVSPQNQTCPMVQVRKQDHSLHELALQSRAFDQATVCEAVLPAQSEEVKTPMGTVRIPQNVQRVAIMGDTGCRLKHTAKGGPVQKCEDENEWPFRKIVRSIAHDNPDVVIHLGDYHYREACTDPVLCKAYEGTVTYGYKGWEADFLSPASLLLKQKAFVFVRGNHEDCHRAYEGFDKLLSPVGQSQCETDQATQYTSFGSLLIVNFDMGSVEDRPYEKKSEGYQKLRARYLEMLKVIASRPEKEVWFVSHKPIWGIAPVGGSIIPTNLNLQRVVEENPFPSKVTFAFAGHIHDFQLARGKHPVQLVVGESGTELDPVPDKPEHTYNLDSGIEVFSPTVKADQFGYALLERKPEGWQAALKNTEGKTEYLCNLWDVKNPCIRP